MNTHKYKPTRIGCIICGIGARSYHRRTPWQTSWAHGELVLNLNQLQAYKQQGFVTKLVLKG